MALVMFMDRWRSSVQGSKAVRAVKEAVNAVIGKSPECLVGVLLSPAWSGVFIRHRRLPAGLYVAKHPAGIEVKRQQAHGIDLDETVSQETRFRQPRR